MIDLGNVKDSCDLEVEISNDDIKVIYHRKSNKHAATVDALRVRQRKLLTRSSKSKENMSRDKPSFGRKKNDKIITQRPRGDPEG